MEYPRPLEDLLNYKRALLTFIGPFKALEDPQYPKRTLWTIELLGGPFIPLRNSSDQLDSKKSQLFGIFDCLDSLIFYKQPSSSRRKAPDYNLFV